MQTPASEAPRNTDHAARGPYSGDEKLARRKVPQGRSRERARGREAARATAMPRPSLTLPPKPPAGCPPS
eukprot:1621388-Rhodomonas_salina.2